MLDRRSQAELVDASAAALGWCTVAANNIAVWTELMGAAWTRAVVSAWAGWLAQAPQSAATAKLTNASENLAAYRSAGGHAVAPAIKV